MTRTTATLGFLLFCLVLAAALPVSADVRPENKWRIQCSESAKSDGAIVFRVTPERSTPIDVRVDVKKGTSENRVAKRIRDVFRETLPKNDFHIEVDDGEDVLITNRLLTGKFGLELVRVYESISIGSEAAREAVHEDVPPASSAIDAGTSLSVQHQGIPAAGRGTAGRETAWTTGHALTMMSRAGGSAGQPDSLFR